MNKNTAGEDMQAFEGQPVVSVITPCFNQGQYLSDLVESVYDGCAPYHEVLIIDDGSTEALTRRCLAKIRSTGKNQEVRVISRQNGGLPAARNTGLDAARGKYIQFLDSDDLVAKGKLDVQIDAMEVDTSIDVHLTEYVLCDASRSRFWRPAESTIAGYAYDCASFVANWERGLTIPIHCGLFRSETIRSLRFNEALKAKEDWIFWVLLASMKVKFEYLPFVGAVYRQHDSNMCKDGRSMALSWLRAIQYLRRSGVAIDEDAQKTLIEHYNRFYVRYLGGVDMVCSRTNAVGRSELKFLLSFVK